MLSSLNFAGRRWHVIGRWAMWFSLFSDLRLLVSSIVVVRVSISLMLTRVISVVVTVPYYLRDLPTSILSAVSLLLIVIGLDLLIRDGISNLIARSSDGKPCGELG